MRKLASAWILVALIAGCGDDVTDSSTSTSTSSQGGGGGSGEGGAGQGGQGGSGVSCESLAGGAANPVTIRIENQKGVPIHLSDECWIGGPDDVKIDGESVLEPLYFYTCNDLIEGKCPPPDCFGGGQITIDPGQAYEATWSGHLRALEETVPAACSVECDFFTITSCKRREPAAPGTHTLHVPYDVEGGGNESVDVSFDLPTTSVLAVVGP